MKLIISLVLLLGYINGSLAVQYTQKTKKSFYAPIGCSLKIENMFGKIEITTHPESTIQVQANKVAYAATEEKAKRECETIEIDFFHSDDEVRIQTIYPDSTVMYRYICEGETTITTTITKTYVDNKEIETVRPTELKQLWVDYEILLPTYVNLFITSQSSPIIIDGMSESVTVNSTNGSIKISDTAGKLKIDTSSSEVNLYNPQQETAEIYTASGNIKLEFNGSQKGKYFIDSASGDIEIVFTQLPSAVIEAETLGGKIHTNLDIPIKSGPGGSKIEHHKLNKGDLRLYLKTASGNIFLHKR